jgi:hypothetical protein
MTSLRLLPREPRKVQQHPNPRKKTMMKSLRQMQGPPTCWTRSRNLRSRRARTSRRRWKRKGNGTNLRLSSYFNCRRVKCLPKGKRGPKAPRELLQATRSSLQVERRGARRIALMMRTSALMTRLTSSWWMMMRISNTIRRRRKRGRGSECIIS